MHNLGHQLMAVLFNHFVLVFVCPWSEDVLPVIRNNFGLEYAFEEMMVGGICNHYPDMIQSVKCKCFIFDCAG